MFGCCPVLSMLPRRKLGFPWPSSPAAAWKGFGCCHYCSCDGCAGLGHIASCSSCWAEASLFPGTTEGSLSPCLGPGQETSLLKSWHECREKKDCLISSADGKSLRKADLFDLFIKPFFYWNRDDPSSRWGRVGTKEAHGRQCALS